MRPNMELYKNNLFKICLYMRFSMKILHINQKNISGIIFSKPSTNCYNNLAGHTIYYHIYSKYFVEFNFIIKHAIEKRECMFWLLVKIQIIAHSSCSFRPHDVCLHYLMLKVYSLHKNRVGNIVSCLILYKNLSWILYSYSLAFVIYTAFKYTNKEVQQRFTTHIKNV